MADQTSLGIPYPESGDHTRLWEHFQDMASAIDLLFLNRPFGVSVAVQTASNIDTCVTTSTSYVNGSASPLNVAFVAPTSGKVMVHLTSDIWNESNGATTSWHSYVSFELTGPTSVSPSDSTSAQNYGAAGTVFTRSVMVSGLFPGGSYTCTMKHRAESTQSEARFTRRQICVQPLV